MESRLFLPEKLALARDLAVKPPRAGSPRLALLDGIAEAER
jgi:hypothetical protein